MFTFVNAFQLHVSNMLEKWCNNVWKMFVISGQPNKTLTNTKPAGKMQKANKILEVKNVFNKCL